MKVLDQFEHLGIDGAFNLNAPDTTFYVIEKHSNHQDIKEKVLEHIFFGVDLAQAPRGADSYLYKLQVN